MYIKLAKKTTKSFLWILFTSLFLGCSPGMVSTAVDNNSVLKSTMTVQPLHRFTPTSILPLPTITETPVFPTQTQMPPTPTTACVTIFYEEYAQFELISSEGNRVLIDVYDPSLLSTPASEGDILLTTHTHWDHVNPEFQKSFPGKQLFIQEGFVEAGDVKIQGIASAHNAADSIKPEGGTNYIYLIEMGGLRVAHFGDIGQRELNPEQLSLLANVDVAITQLANEFSEMSAENQKGFNLVGQVEPQLIIPTHVNFETATLAVSQWQGLFSPGNSKEICKSDLSGNQEILFLGQFAENYWERLSLKLADW